MADSGQLYRLGLSELPETTDRNFRHFDKLSKNIFTLGKPEMLFVKAAAS